jgi:hypothetical protein
VSQVHEYEVAVLAQVALGPHMPGVVQRSTVEQLVGPPVTVAPKVPEGQRHSYEPGMFAHIPSVPQSGEVAHSSTSVQLAGPPEVVVPVKPGPQRHSHEPGVLTQRSFEPQLPLRPHSSMSTQAPLTQSRADVHCAMPVQLVGQVADCPLQT